MNKTAQEIGIWHGIRKNGKRIDKLDPIKIRPRQTQEEKLFEMKPPTNYLERFYYELFRDEEIKESLGISLEKPVYKAEIGIDTNSSIKELKDNLGVNQTNKILKTADEFCLPLSVCIRCYLFWNGYIGTSSVKFDKNGVLKVSLLGRITKTEMRKVVSKYEKMLAENTEIIYKSQRDKQTRKGQYDETIYYDIHRSFLEEKKKNPKFLKSEIIKKVCDKIEKSGDQSNMYKTLDKMFEETGITWQ